MCYGDVGAGNEICDRDSVVAASHNRALDGVNGDKAFGAEYRAVERNHRRGVVGFNIVDGAKVERQCVEVGSDLVAAVDISDAKRVAAVEAGIYADVVEGSLSPKE